MAEAIHCPSCSTRYRFRAERLRPAIRRAKCCTCGGVFPVGDIVQRLLAPKANLGSTAAFHLEDLERARQASHLAPDTSLVLDDLQGVDAEILERTLAESPTALPESKSEVPQPAREAAPAPSEATLSGYTSARDAIDKLFGDAPAAAGGLKVNQEPDAMDVEATLTALESTLGGAVNPAASATATHGDSPTAAGLTDEDLAGSSSSTLRIPQEDMQALSASVPTPAAEPTVALRASDLIAAVPQAARLASAAAPLAAPLAAMAPSEPGAELLRLKIGEEIYGGLSMPQLIAWVNEGRILENHLVARQHSENWLEAHKVPGLRPVFERLRRERSGGAPSLEIAPSEVAPKKSLFGGLFGKG